MRERRKPVATIVAVDDAEMNVLLLRTILTPHGYRVQTFTEPRAALAAAATDVPDLFLLDISMPEMDGYQLCEALKQLPSVQDVPVLFISANESLQGKLRAFETGGVDYITKPFHPAEVLARVKTHLTMRALQRQLQQQNQHLRELVDAQVRDIMQTREELERAQFATIMALSKLAESRDDCTGRHIERVERYCLTLAEHLSKRPEFAEQLDATFISLVAQASPLHDIGKVGIADAVLLKPARLTVEEFDEMKRHTLIGVDTLETVRERFPASSFISIGIAITGYHHEWWNGEGYPHRLAGEAIPLAARIVAVADAYDALRSERCYKPAYSHGRAKEIILAESGIHFDPRIVETLVGIEDEFQDVRRQLGD